MSSSTKALWNVDEDCNDFLPWLERKAGAKISCTLSIGGRGLYASENIKKGDLLLKIPFSVQLAQDNLPPEISISLGNYHDPVTKVALLIQNWVKIRSGLLYISAVFLCSTICIALFSGDDSTQFVLCMKKLRN
ncbi:hypothetical protein ACS0TY_019140 [Phlomoides rotata]